MINGPRRSRIDWNSTEIEASKVRKPRGFSGFPGHCVALELDARDVVRHDDGVAVEPEVERRVVLGAEALVVVDEEEARVRAVAHEDGDPELERGRRGRVAVPKKREAPGTRDESPRDAGGTRWRSQWMSAAPGDWTTRRSHST